MRKTKIICTMGPACQDEKTLTKLCLAGMNVARLNFSHGTHESHQIIIDRIKRIREQLNLPIAIMLDTKGPEFRTGRLRDGPVMLKEGQSFVFTTQDVFGDETRVSVSYGGLMQDLAPGDTILVNNGLMVFRVEEVGETEARCTVLAGGLLSDHKSMSFPNKIISQPYLSSTDRSDILFGVANDVDYISCSFVSRKEDLELVRALLEQHNAAHIGLIAKIENQSGVDNFDSISAACEGVMIGRGDLGVEVAFEKLPAIQKHIIRQCVRQGKHVITATEMLESMIHNIRPTRAEISDVANAVYDGTSAVMLSGETAAGEHPVEAVATMARIAEYTESGISYTRRLRRTELRMASTVDAVSRAACELVADTGASALVACSLSGATVQRVSRFRPPADILGVTISQRVWRSLALYWGVTPALCEELPSSDVLFYSAKKLAKEYFHLTAGDRIVITGGTPNGKSGNTDLIKVDTI